MSHTIIYNRLFIKATDEDNVDYYVPMILCGSSNCTQISEKTGREILERSWNSFKWATGGKNLATEQEILSIIDKDRLERMEYAAKNVEKYKDQSWAYDDKNYGYHSSIRFSGRSYITFSAFRSYFENGMKNAYTIEELLKHGVNVVLHVSSFWEKEYKEAGLEIKPDIYIKTSEQLIEKTLEYDAYYKNVGGCFIEFSIDYSVDRFLDWLKRERKYNKPRKETIIVDVDSYFVLSNNNGFFVKNTRYGYKYGYSSDSFSVKKWINKKGAESFLKSLIAKGRNSGWQVVEVREKTRIKA